MLQLLANNPQDFWAKEDADELLALIRVPVLNLGYLPTIGPERLSKLELIFTPGEAHQLSVALSNGMRNAFLYVNGANHAKLLKWLDRLWGNGGDDPTATFGHRAHMNGGAVGFGDYKGKDSNNNHVYIRRNKECPLRDDLIKTFQVGKDRTIQVTIRKDA